MLYIFRTLQNSMKTMGLITFISGGRGLHHGTPQSNGRRPTGPRPTQCCRSASNTKLHLQSNDCVHIKLIQVIFLKLTVVCRLILKKLLLVCMKEANYFKETRHMISNGILINSLKILQGQTLKERFKCPTLNHQRSNFKKTNN